MSSNNQTRTQKLNLDKKYAAYLARNGEPASTTTNPLNLFDELNFKDRVWFKRVRAYMKKRACLPAGKRFEQ